MAVARPQILLVEDRSDVAAMYELAFRTEGFETRIAATGADALAIAASGWPDLVVLDLQLPDIDGFAVFDQMRARRISTPVIFLTIRDDVPAMERAFGSGAVDYLIKPRVKPSEIVDRIRRHLASGT